MKNFLQHRVISVIVCLYALFFLSACSFMQSTVMHSSPTPTFNINNETVENQVPYFLPTGKLNIKINKSDCSKITVETVYVPDRLLFLKYNPSIFSSDKDITINRSTEGFLTGIHSKTEDETADIIAGLAKIAKMAIGIPAAFMSDTKSEKTCSDLNITFNPLKSDELESASIKLKKSTNSAIKNIDITPLFTLNKNTSIKSQPSEVEGVYYLTRLPYQFNIEMSNPADKVTSVVFLPNESPLFVLDIKRKPFVENSIDITFDNGILTMVKWNKPSEALGFVNIPIDIAKSIMAIPSELLTVKVKNLANEKAFIDAQTQYIKAQMELEKIKTQEK